ncbi:hypothetical protein ACWCP6_09325 [Streptomyces sp. NPDC002004]
MSVVRGAVRLWRVFTGAREFARTTTRMSRNGNEASPASRVVEVLKAQ